MKTTYILKWIVGLTMFGVLVFVGALYLLASRVPSGYRPEMLDSRQRVVYQTFRQKTLEEFGSGPSRLSHFVVFTEERKSTSLRDKSPHRRGRKTGGDRLMGKAEYPAHDLHQGRGFILMTRSRHKILDRSGCRHRRPESALYHPHWHRLGELPHR